MRILACPITDTSRWSPSSSGISLGTAQVISTRSAPANIAPRRWRRIQPANTSRTNRRRTTEESSSICTTMPLCASAKISFPCEANASPALPRSRVISGVTHQYATLNSSLACKTISKLSEVLNAHHAVLIERRLFRKKQSTIVELIFRASVSLHRRGEGGKNAAQTKTRRLICSESTAAHPTPRVLKRSRPTLHGFQQRITLPYPLIMLAAGKPPDAKTAVIQMTTTRRIPFTN